MSYYFRFITLNIKISSNSQPSHQSLRIMMSSGNLVVLCPLIQEADIFESKVTLDFYFSLTWRFNFLRIKIGCFGAHWLEILVILILYKFSYYNSLQSLCFIFLNRSFPTVSLDHSIYLPDCSGSAMPSISGYVRQLYVQILISSTCIITPMSKKQRVWKVWKNPILLHHLGISFGSLIQLTLSLHKD